MPAHPLCGMRSCLEYALNWQAGRPREVELHTAESPHVFQGGGRAACLMASVVHSWWSTPSPLESRTPSRWGCTGNAKECRLVKEPL